MAPPALPKPPQPSAQSPLVTEKGLENPQSAAARRGAVLSVSETRANTKCGVIGGFLIRGPLCGGAEPAAALPSRGLSAAGGPGRRAPRAPQRIINRASQGPGQRRPFTPPLLPPTPGILLFLKTAASWAAEKRQLCGRMSGQAAEERRSSVSALRAGFRGPGSPGWAGGPGSFLKSARLLRKPRDFHGALEASAMEMVMGGIEAVLREGERGCIQAARTSAQLPGGRGRWTAR